MPWKWYFGRGATVFETCADTLDRVSGFGTASYGMGPVGGNSKCGGVGRAGVDSDKALEGGFGRDALMASRAVRSGAVHRKTMSKVKNARGNFNLNRLVLGHHRKHLEHPQQTHPKQWQYVAALGQSKNVAKSPRTVLQCVLQYDCEAEQCVVRVLSQ